MTRNFIKSEYIYENQYHKLVYAVADLNYKEFECCKFVGCNFSDCAFQTVTFIDCLFEDCNFSGAKINFVAFRTVVFNSCKIEDVNFAMCDKLIFEIEFNNCILDFSKFYSLKIKGTNFSNCRLIAVDFMGTDLTGVVFDNCDLYKAEFDLAIANKTNFKTSKNYTIDPSKTKLKKAVFSLVNVKGLLHKYDIEVK
jgi:uncharacterized protein YjbI with pentapeptide repeats